PRIVQHPAQHRRYTSDNRRGLPAVIDGSPPERSRALSQLRASYTLDDLTSPDLEAVLFDISRDRRSSRRRRRAVAALACLARAWERLGEQAEVMAADDWYGWQTRGATKAFWVWRAAAVPWLDDAAGQPTPPLKLRLRTAGTVAVHGPNAAGYLHRELHRDRRVLAAFGITGEPTTAELVDRLRVLQASGSDSLAAGADAGVVYQALADRLGSHQRIPGDLSLASLRTEFGEGKGLIRTNIGWRQPSQVFAGAPIFGGRRPFAPAIAGVDRLWSVLQLRI